MSLSCPQSIKRAAAVENTTIARTPPFPFAFVFDFSICPLRSTRSPVDVSGSGETPESKPVRSTLPESQPRKRFLVGCSSSPFQCDSPNTTSRRFASGFAASDVCLVGENPTCSVPALYIGMRGSMVIRLRPCMAMSTPHLGEVGEDLERGRM